MSLREAIFGKSSCNRSSKFCSYFFKELCMKLFILFTTYLHIFVNPFVWECSHLVILLSGIDILEYINALFRYLFESDCMKVYRTQSMTCITLMTHKISFFLSFSFFLPNCQHWINLRSYANELGRLSFLDWFKKNFFSHPYLLPIFLRLGKIITFQGFRFIHTEHSYFSKSNDLQFKFFALFHSSVRIRQRKKNAPDVLLFLFI